MKIISLFLTAILLSTVTFAQSGEQIDLQKVSGAHPRLLWKAGEEKLTAAAIQKHPEWKRAHEAILESCRLMDGMEPVAHVKIGIRLLDKSRECLRRVFQLSYAYRITGERRYLLRAEKELLAVAAFPDWNPSHFLDVAEMTLGVAIGYDWLYNDLSETTRKKLEEAILEKGIKPSFDPKFNGFVKSTNNWNQVCNAGMTFGAIAISDKEPELAKEVIGRALKGIPEIMKISYSPDGVYPEGYSYWDYGTGFNVLFISAMEKAFGSDFGLTKMPGFMQTSRFVQHIVGPVGMVHNWSDCGLREGVNPALFWFATREKNPSLVFGQRRLLVESSSAKLVSDRLLPSLLIWGTALDLGKPAPPMERMWVGQGPNPVGFMRSSWTDSTATFVGFKAGSPGVSHGHMDVGSFVIDAEGERWAMDFGMQDYNSMESQGVKVFGRDQHAQRWEIFRYNNLVHNTLTIDSAYQRVKGFAAIDRQANDKRGMRLLSDLSQVYDGQLKKTVRGINLIRKNYVVVRDEVEVPEKDVTLRWTLLTAALPTIIDGETVRLFQNGKEMLLKFKSSVPINIKTWSTTPNHSYDAPNPGTYLVGFEAIVPKFTAQWFNASFVGKGEKEQGVGKLAAWF